MLGLDRTCLLFKMALTAPQVAPHKNQKHIRMALNAKWLGREGNNWMGYCMGNSAKGWYLASAQALYGPEKASTGVLWTWMRRISHVR